MRLLFGWLVMLVGSVLWKVGQRLFWRGLSWFIR